METVFLVCVVLGVLTLLLQIGAGLAGLDHQGVDGHGLEEGLGLLSIRSLAAGVAAFGAVGLWAAGSFPALIATVLAAPAGLLGMVATAYLTRTMLRLQSDGSLDLDEAVGAIGEVYLPVPGAGNGTGLVHIPLRERNVELRARTSELEALPRGSSVLVISVDAEQETVEVVATSKVKGLMA
jgi:hypothetical protein